MVKSNKLPFKVGDKVKIISKPREWSSGEGGSMGLGLVKYPYEFTVKRIADHDDHIAIFDGKYGWTYFSDTFQLQKGIKKDATYKYKVNDRVRHCDYGDGTVKDAEDQDDIGVEFDNEMGGHSLCHDLVKSGHGWWCRNRNIVLISKSKFVEVSDESLKVKILKRR